MPIHVLSSLGSTIANHTYTHSYVSLNACTLRILLFLPHYHLICIPTYLHNHTVDLSSFVLSRFLMANPRHLHPLDRIFQDTALLPDPYVCSRHKELDDTLGTVGESDCDAQPAIKERAFEGWGFEEIRKTIRWEELRREYCENGIVVSTQTSLSQRPQSPMPTNESSGMLSNILSSRRARFLLQAKLLGRIIYIGHFEVPKYPCCTIQVEAPYSELDPTVSPKNIWMLSMMLSKGTSFPYNLTSRIPHPPLSPPRIPQLGQAPLADDNSQATYPVPQGSGLWMEDPVRQATLRHYDRRISTLRMWLWRVFFENKPIFHQLSLDGRSQWSRTYQTHTLADREIAMDVPNSAGITSRNSNVVDGVAYDQDGGRRHTIQAYFCEKEERPKSLVSQDAEYHDQLDETLDEEEMSSARDLSSSRRSSIDLGQLILRGGGSDDSNPNEGFDGGRQKQESQTTQKVPRGTVAFTDLSGLNDALSKINDSSREVFVAAHNTTSSRVKALLDAPNQSPYWVSDEKLQPDLDASDQSWYCVSDEKSSYSAHTTIEDSFQPSGGKFQTDIDLHKSQLPGSEYAFGSSDDSSFSDTSSLSALSFGRLNSLGHQSMPSYEKSLICASDRSFDPSSTSDRSSTLYSDDGFVKIAVVPRQGISYHQQSLSPNFTLSSRPEEWHIHLSHHRILALKEEIGTRKIELSRLNRRIHQVEAKFFSKGLELRRHQYNRSRCIASLGGLRPVDLFLFPCARRPKPLARTVETGRAGLGKIHMKAKGAIP